MKHILILELLANVAHAFHHFCGDHAHGFWCLVNLFLLSIGIVRLTKLAMTCLQRGQDPR
jgi:hypothetical protein